MGSTIILTLYFKKQRPFLTREVNRLELQSGEAEVDWVGGVKECELLTKMQHLSWERTCPSPSFYSLALS